MFCENNMRKFLLSLIVLLTVCCRIESQTIQQPLRVSIILRDADIPIVLEMLFKATNNRVVVDKAISGSVSKLEMLDISWDLVLKTVCETCDLVIVIDKNNVYWIKNKPGTKRNSRNTTKIPD